MLCSMMVIIRKTLLLTILIFILAVKANAAYYKNNCDKQKLGWNFYCDTKVENPQKENQSDSSDTQDKETELTLGEFATRQIEAMRKKHDELLNIATIFPTEENVKNYIAFNQKIMNQSSYFSEVSSRTIWKNPELDYSLKRPVNSIGKKTWIDNRNQELEKAVTSLNQRYGIFFLYRSDCPYCHAYSPVLKSFALQYNLKVMPISLDGGHLAEWPETKIDEGQSKLLEIKVVPATVLFDKQTSEIIPVGFGVLSHEELKNRIYTLTQTKPGETL